MPSAKPLDDPLCEFLAQRVARALIQETTQPANANNHPSEARDRDDHRSDLQPVLDGQAG
jgi:hypothetical protein